MKKKIPQNELIRKIVTDKKIRRAIAKESHRHFFSIYLSHYLKHQTAPFQQAMFSITENNSIKSTVMVAFRGSAKSTIMTLSYSIWAILGKQQKKFVVILSQTQRQARQHLTNLKQELESNKLLRSDLGPFEEQKDEWGSYSLVIPKYGARISAASSEQSIRGLRHGQHRPDLIICDDIEDLDSVRTQESRDKTYDWLTGDVIPAGDQNTKLIVVGNLLHEDSLMMRLKQDIKEDRFDGIYREYPFMDKENNILWKSKFPDQQAIENERRKIGSELSWQREYMLKIISNAERVIHPEWIHYYNKLPDIKDEKNEYRYAVTAIDLAISLKDKANFTAMLSARVFGWGKNIKIYILPYPVNERLNFPETVKKVKEVSRALGNGIPTKLYIEEVGYQKALVDELKKELYPAEGVPVHGQDKRARLYLTTTPLQAGNILFPREEINTLIQQLIGFGVERYDDLSDAFAMLIGEIMRDNERPDPFPDQGDMNDPRGKPFTAGLLEKEF